MCVDSRLPGARSNLERLARHDQFAFVSVAWAACRNSWKRAAASCAIPAILRVARSASSSSSGDSDVCRRLGSRARPFADSELRPERHLDALLDVYHAVERSDVTSEPLSTIVEITTRERGLDFGSRCVRRPLRPELASRRSGDTS